MLSDSVNSVSLKKHFRGKRQRRRKRWHKKWEIGRIYKALEQESQRTCLMFELYFLTGCRRDARCRDFPPLEGRDQYNPQSDIVRIRRRSGVTDFRLHDCRRTLASLLPRLQEAVGFSKK
jgi:hypothetical protein